MEGGARRGVCGGKFCKGDACILRSRGGALCRDTLWRGCFVEGMLGKGTRFLVGDALDMGCYVARNALGR